MSGPPKLKIKLPFAHVEDEICDLEQAKDRFKWGNETFLITIAGRVINSYEELVQIAGRDDYKDTEFLEVHLFLLIGGG